MEIFLGISKIGNFLENPKNWKFSWKYHNLPTDKLFTRNNLKTTFLRLVDIYHVIGTSGDLVHLNRLYGFRFKHIQS